MSVARVRAGGGQRDAARQAAALLTALEYSRLEPPLTIRPTARSRAVADGRTRPNGGGSPLLLFVVKSQRNPVFFTAVIQLQILHFHLLQREVEQSSRRLIRLLFGKHFVRQQLLQRRVLRLVGILHFGLHIGWGVAAASRSRAAAHAADAESGPRRLVAGPVLIADDDQRRLSGDLARLEGRRFLHFVHIAQHEIIVRNHDVFAVFWLHLHVGHHVMAFQVGPEQLLHVLRRGVDRDRDNQFLILAARRDDGLLGSGLGKQRRQKK